MAGRMRAPAKAAQFEFKCGSSATPDQPSSVRLTQMWSAIERESGGRIHTQFFPNSQLGSQAAMLTQLRLGALHFYLINPGDLAAVVPAFDVSFLGFVFKDSAQGFRVMDGPLGTYLRGEAASKGIYTLRAIWDSGMNQIGSSSHPIRSPEDLRGFKIRVVASKIVADLFRVLAASPTPIALNEVYTALQTKLVDGIAGTLVYFETGRLYEVQKYAALTNHAWTGLRLIANGDVWKRLPSDLQAIVERNNTKYAALERRDTELFTASVGDKLTRQGMIINRVDQAPFRARLAPYYQEWATAFGPTVWNLLETSLGQKLI
jgi:TRAP-type transport system periplasmic protein